ncbi:MAG: lipid IV(A) 3-deoxy-D-manno-octulosonic acid transferase [Gammaproteobacteria bacterium]|nr:lipid IV(A) 3-deoxy-D-manno-octulosonic acid transferase [Gammaproteobacteria bacterium]MBT8151344.1 lipid IV(A) 3-deoxy-D-manno-octulosonic acid transferase [Gammaproteobacteria bacterium]NND39998.1 3-deoxy-D-manno-octulosonic acid transferase [Pseudomonadales bacterium]NNL10397.1 3-deoxy-D-manno-octulosonic acid transferase [Pseudomonadales bacterium]NNM12244.1 3-deoxy-D-manno-octulosonic acid transferase [Pseudomonadales bacterium]
MFYIVLLTLLLPLLPLRLLWRSRKAPDYRKRMAERFGFRLPRPRAGGIWVHAVSVGETFAASTTIRELLRRQPDRSLTITSTTPTGSAQVTNLFGDSVSHCYAPYDWPLFVWLFLRRVRPDLLVVVETEIWPVTLLLCRGFGIDVVLANARLSEKSARGYRKVRWLIEPAIAKVWVAAQHQDDAQRLIALGANEARVRVTGSVKFDVVVDQALRDAAQAVSNAFAEANHQPVWIAASTHAGEETDVLAAHRALLAQYPRALLVLAPRHPDRCQEVAKEVLASGFTLAMRSAASSPAQAAENPADVLLVDTLGELMIFFGAAQLAFIGGSLVPVGGHNYLEPACWGLPILSGPHTHNFSNIAEQLAKVGALAQVRDAGEFASAVIGLCDSSEQRQQRGSAASKLLSENRGAGERLLALVEERLE